MNTSAAPNDLLEDLAARELVQDCNDLKGLRARLAEAPVKVYCGFDPTATSLHVGSLMGLSMLRRVLHHGHSVIVLLGGATGMIGDPSGKSAERNLLDHTTLLANRAALRKQILPLLGDPGEQSIETVDNYDWFAGLSVLDFLRDIGKFVSLEEMLEKASVKTRRAAGGMSFTEFSYQVLQGHDFAHLFEHHSCELQIGGSDQYGNILAGTDMVRRRELGRAYGLVWPLMVKDDGEKFGKTANGAIWLDPTLTSPYAFHQYFFNITDGEVGRLLAQLTMLSMEDVEALMTEHRRAPYYRVAQRALADTMTTWVHGKSACDEVHSAQAVIFGTGTALDTKTVELLTRELPTLWLSSSELLAIPVERLVTRAGLTTSVTEARELMQGNGISVDGRRMIAGERLELNPDRPWALLARGRRNHALLRIGG